MLKSFLFRTSLLLAPLAALHGQAKEDMSTDILIVGGTESGWAAAIQAARMGCKSITVVHDGPWLGGGPVLLASKQGQSAEILFS